MSLIESFRFAKWWRQITCPHDWQLIDIGDSAFEYWQCSNCDAKFDGQEVFG